MQAEIESAYKYCENVTRHNAKSFYFASKFLPRHKLKAVFPIYALCRHIDDEIDEAAKGNEEEAVKAVNRWKANLQKLYRSNANDNHIVTTREQQLVFLAWKNLLETYKIPENLPLELIEGVLMDTLINRFETFDELYVYCYRVASTVGLMSSEVLGYSNPKALDYAEALGIAMQLTNILRDVKEDARMNRIYLPQEDLRKFNVSEQQIFAGIPDENFIELMKFEIHRAREYYRKGERGIALLENDSRFTVLLASRTYSQILDEIERQNYNVFARRAHTSFSQKILSIPKIWREAKSI